MAATATAQSFNPQNAAADLRRSQRAALLNQQPLRDIPEISPANNNNFENTLPQESQFRAAEQRQRTLNATRRDVLPSPAEESESEEELMEQEAAAQAEQYIRTQSFSEDVLQMGPTRAMKQQLADRAAKFAADKAKQKAKELAARLLVIGADEVVDPIVDLTEGAAAETDLGFFTWSDIAYDYARLGVTVLVPAPTDVGDTAGDAASYTASKAIHLLIPPYKFIFGGANIIDLADDAMAVFKLGIVSTILIVIFIFLIIVLGLFGFGAYYLGSSFSLSGLAGVLSSSTP